MNENQIKNKTMHTSELALSNENLKFDEHKEKRRNRVGEIVNVHLYDINNTIVNGTIIWEGFDETVDMWIFEIKPEQDIPNLISLFRSEEEILL